MKTHYELLKYLSEKTGLDIYEKLPYTPGDPFNYPVHGVYKGAEMRFGATTLKGGIRAFTVIAFPIDRWDLHGLTFPMDDNDLEAVYMKRRRVHTEFGVEVKNTGKKHKWDEGGGWYSMQDIYEIDNEQFVLV